VNKTSLEKSSWRKKRGKSILVTKKQYKIVCGNKYDAEWEEYMEG
jgi:hypothetical protein